MVLPVAQEAVPLLRVVLAFPPAKVMVLVVVLMALIVRPSSVLPIPRPAGKVPE